MWTLKNQLNEYYEYRCDYCGKSISTMIPPHYIEKINLICECRPKPPPPPPPKASWQALVEESKLPKKLLEIESPPNTQLANMVYSWRYHNLMITGASGTGKSTAVVATAKYLMKKEAVSIRYYSSLNQIISEYRKKKVSEFDSSKFFREHAKYNILIIDEALSDTQPNLCKELLFELVDAIYRGDTSTHLWLVGNFYQDCFKTIFPDPSAFYRRLQKCFRGIQAPDLSNAKFISIGEQNQGVKHD